MKRICAIYVYMYILIHIHMYYMLNIRLKLLRLGEINKAHKKCKNKFPIFKIIAYVLM